MCWCTKNKNYATPIVAEKDFKVYKVLVVTGDSILSPCQDFEWKLGALYEEDIKVNTTGVKEIIYNPTEIDEESYNGAIKPARDLEVLETNINDGFHSLKFPPIRKDDSWCIGDKELFSCASCDIVFEAIIPKGSVYYENEDGEIVSTALKLKGIYLEENIKNKFKGLCYQEKK